MNLGAECFAILERRKAYERAERLEAAKRSEKHSRKLNADGLVDGSVNSRVLAWVRAQKRTVSTKEVAEGMGMPVQRARTACNDLVRAGLLKRPRPSYFRAER